MTAAPEVAAVPPVDRRRLVLVGAVTALLLALAGVVAYAFGGDVPRGTRVLGVDLGGKSRSEAERALHERFDPRAGEPVRVDLAGRTVTVSPAAVAMSLDVDRTVGRAMRGSPSFSPREVPPVVRLDQARLAAVLRRSLLTGAVTGGHLGTAYGRPLPAYGRPVPTYGRPVPVHAAARQDLDPAAAAAAVKGAWLTGRTAIVPLRSR